MNSSEYLLQVRNLKIYYYTYEGVVKAVDGVSFNIKRGEALGIAGESGCGKSTLAYGLLRIVPIPGKIVGGKVIFDGTDILQLPESEFKRKYRWKRISMVFQGAMNSLDPVKNIGKQIADVILTHEENISKSEAYKRANELLKLVGIDPARAKSYPHELSGGMKQRVVIAMALALNPDLLIADEPTTALDVVVQAQIINLLKDLKEKLRMSLILITHDLSIIAEIADKVAIMYAGKIVELGRMEDIYEDPKHPYTSKLLRSIPRLRGKASLEWIPGQPPDLKNPPHGCRFHPRCPHAMDKCRREEPPVISLGRDRFVSCWLHAKR